MNQACIYCEAEEVTRGYPTLVECKVILLDDIDLETIKNEINNI